MPDLRTMKERAAEHARKGRFDKAVGLLSTVVATDPKDLAARQKLGEALRRAGNPAQAIHVFAELAEAFAAQGETIKAIAVCKVVLDLDPAHVETQEVLAALHARRRAEPSRPVGATPGRGLGTGLPAAREAVLEIEPLAGPSGERHAAERDATWTDRASAVLVLPPPPDVAAARAAALAEAPAELGLSEPPVAAPAPEPAPSERPLPAIPLFSDLSREAFVAVAGKLALLRFPAGGTVIREGDRGRSLFVVVSGRLRVERARPEGPLVLARLGDGDFFGEMALLSGDPRMASVVAEHDAELLELSAPALAELCRAHHSVAVALTRFYKQRLLANVVATNPLFQPFAPHDRDALVRRFETVEVPAGALVVRQGARSDGLFVVLSGRYDVVRGEGGATLAELREGDLFGEMSCLTKRPATANVVVRRRGIVLKLARAVFDEVASTHPQVLELVAEIADQRNTALAGGPQPFPV